jgi:hypothetical protein
MSFSHSESLSVKRGHSEPLDPARMNFEDGIEHQGWFEFGAI